MGENGVEGLPKPKADGGTLVFDGLVNLVHLFLDVDMVFWKIPEPAKVLDGLLTLACEHEPSRRFLDEEDSDKQHASWNELNREGDDPLFMRWWHILVHTIVDLMMLATDVAK